MPYKKTSFFLNPSEKKSPLLLILGWMMMALSLCLWAPIAFSIVYQEKTFQAFMMTSVLSFFLGAVLVLFLNQRGLKEPSFRQGIILTLTCWVSMCVFSAMPFYFSGTVSSFTDALFESVSALTTTGLTFLEQPSEFPESIKFWRVFMQWIGGFGIILMAMILLPMLKIGGANLMSAEFSDRSEKIMPRASQIAFYLILLYVGITVLSAVSLYFCHLSIMDSLYYSMSSISTGGIVVAKTPLSDLSNTAKFILTLTMIVGGSTLIHLLSFLKKHVQSYFKDDQILAYYGILLGSVGVCFLWMFFHQKSDWMNGFFMTTSALTTTGYSLKTSYGAFLSMFFLLLSYLGGCSGSTSGGLKIFRAQILYRISKAQILRMLHPHGVFLVLYNKVQVQTEVILSIVTTVFFYILGWFLIALLLSVLGNPILHSLTVASGLITNSGMVLSSFGDQMISWSDFEKWTAIFAMLCGRFECVTLVCAFALPFLRR